MFLSVEKFILSWLSWNYKKQAIKNHMERKHVLYIIYW